MTDKEWFMVLTETKYGIYRYAIEYWLLPFDGFGSDEAYKEWLTAFKDYFVKRTAIKERVVAVEPAQFLTAYGFDTKVTDLADEGRAVSADLSSPPQSTIDSEVEDILGGHDHDSFGFVCDTILAEDYDKKPVCNCSYKERKNKLEHKIAQEANKARLDTISDMIIECYNHDSPMELARELLEERRRLEAQLKADKEKA